MSWKNILKGAFAAIIGGAAANAAVYLADPGFLTGPAFGKRIGIVAAVGAAQTLAAYLKTPPQQ